jgi:DHA3 family macrolide efflux protein-like MFS transporter
MLSSYLHILRKRNFFLLWFGQVISQFGDRLTQMALIGLVYRFQQSSAVGLAKIMSLPIVAVFLISPIAGVYVDRWNKQKIMYLSDFLRAIFIVAIPLLAFYLQSLSVTYVLIFLSFCIGRFFIPAKLAIVPELVDEDQVLLANSLVSTTAMIAAVLGFGLGGFIVEKMGVTWAFMIDGGTFLLSALAIRLMSLREKKGFRAVELLYAGKDAFTHVKKDFISEMKEGLTYLFKTKETRYAAKMFSLLFSCIGALYVVFIVFIQKTFNTITSDLGLFAVASGIGLFVGSLLYGRLGRNWPVSRVINVSLMIVSLYLIGFVSILRFYPIKLFALFSCFMLGFLSSPMVIGINTLVHNESQNEYWGRVFSSLEVVIHLAFIVCMFIASFLAERFSAFTIIISVGIIIFFFACFNPKKNHDPRRRT